MASKYDTTHAEAAEYLKAHPYRFRTTEPNDPAYKPCPRCGGSGRYAYNPMDGDMCYGCRGRGWFPAGGNNLQRAMRLATADKKKAAARARKRWAARRELRKLDPELRAAFIRLRHDEPNFVASIRNAVIKYGYATPKQAAAVIAAKGVAEIRAEEAARRAAEDAQKVTAPVGRHTIVGEVLTVKVRDTAFGEVLKMLLKVPSGDGFYKVWCTVPSAIETGCEKGTRVRLTVTLKASPDDLSFAFGSRPAGASVVVD